MLIQKEYILLLTKLLPQLVDYLQAIQIFRIFQLGLKKEEKFVKHLDLMILIKLFFQLIILKLNYE